MLMSFAKRIALAYLERSTDPELRELAAWIKDAEGRVVDLILDAMGQSLRTTGDIGAAKEQLQQMHSASQTGAPPDPLNAWLHSAPWLVEQARVVRTVASLAAWRRAIYLKGFFHDADCTSLWHFSTTTALDIHIVDSVLGGHELSSVGTELKIYLSPTIETPKLVELNRSIGANYSQWLAASNLDSLDRVHTIAEDSVTIAREVHVEKVGRRGSKTMSSETTFIKLPIENRKPAYDALLTSLPVALDARDHELHEVRKKLQ
jgi:hypothetical protein